MTRPHDAIGDATSGMAATVPAHACTDGAGASPVGVRKLADLVERGHDVIGHILHKDGQYALLDGSCRWLTKPHYQRLMHEQDSSLFGATSAYHTAKLRAAIADARHVFEGQKVAEDVLHYLEQVLAAGAPVPAQTGITVAPAGFYQQKFLLWNRAQATPPVAIAKEMGVAEKAVELYLAEQVPPMVDSDPFRVATRQAVMWQAAVDGFEQEAAALSDATKIASPMCSKFDRAAAAMAAESAQKVADAERHAAHAAGQVALKTLAALSREVFSLSGQLQQPADLAVQLLMLAELRILKEYGRVTELSNQNCIRRF